MSRFIYRYGMCEFQLSGSHHDQSYSQVILRNLLGGFMDSINMEASGLNGQVELWHAKVRIRRKGQSVLSPHRFSGDKDMALSQITAIQFKKTGTITSGYIQFAFPGAQEAKQGLVEAMGDENTVAFRKAREKAFEALKEAVEKVGETLKSSVMGTASYLGEPERLATLLDQGVLTQDEFVAKKRQILGL
jgi:hypothetical protein